MDEAKLRESKSRANKTLIGSILIIAMELGTLTTLSNYIGGWCEKFGASVTQIVIVFSIASVLSLICNFISAAAIAKVPAKLLVLIGSLGYIGFFVAAVLGKNLSVLYVGAALFGVGQTFACYTVLQPVIAWWHVDNVGKKISALSVGYCIAAFGFSMIVPRAINAIGFEKTQLLHGAIGGAIMLLSALFLISNKPESYGLKPYGYKETAGGTGAYTVSGLTVKESVKTFTFWAILLASIFCGIAACGYANNSALIYQSLGMDSIGAGNMIAIYSLMTIVWTFGYGVVSDKLSPRKANLIFCAIDAVVFLIASFLFGLPGSILVAVTFGVATFYGMLPAVTFPALYGTKAVGTLIALGMAASAGSAMVAPIIASSMYERSGDFSGFFQLSAVLLALAFVLLATSTSKAAVAKIKAAAAEHK